MVAEMSGIRIVNSLPDRGWRAFIAANPNSNIFHTPEMFEVFARAERHHPTLWAAVDAEGCPLALLLPVQVTLFDSLPRRLTTRAIVYGSLLWQAGEAGMQALNELLNAYIREMGGKALFTELRNTSDLSAVRSVLQEHRFVHQDYLNYLIDLDMSPEALLQSIGPRTRKNIRRALNRGVVEVEEVRDERGLRAWYEVLQKTYRNARVPLANLSLFQAALEVLLPKGMVRFSQARVGADIVATSVELLYERSIYGWYGGIDRDSAYPGANELLMWKILAWGAEGGYTIYDFGGAGKPDQPYGPREFKAKFNGKLVNYGRDTFIGSPLQFQLTSFAYEVYRRFI